MICTVLYDLVSEDVNLYCEILVNCVKIYTVDIIFVLVRHTDKYQISEAVDFCVFFSYQAIVKKRIFVSFGNIVSVCL